MPKTRKSNSQTGIPFLFMRGGTSRGPHFNRADLPKDEGTLANVLIQLLGSGHPFNIDGIGGGVAVTTKVAMLSPSEDADSEDGADIDYYFAQVGVTEKLVDFRPTCGNTLAGVAAACLEMGLVSAADGVTDIRIRAVNTGARVRARVRTPGGRVDYGGDASIDGVPGTASPVELDFIDVVGSSTGALLPTGNLMDTFAGIEVTCMDVAMPVVIARAADFGLTGLETREELNANTKFFENMEAIRLEAGRAMGMGDCSQSVTPKFGLVAPLAGPGVQPGQINTRYFMPWETHPSLAVTGGLCLASCALTPGTVADGLMEIPDGTPATVTMHHPMGSMAVVVDYSLEDGSFKHKSSCLVRTTRKLAEGRVFVPANVWDGS